MATTTDMISDPTLNGSRVGSPADGTKLPGERSTGINSGLNVSSQVSVGQTKPVDFKSLEGSYTGDHRGPNTGATTTDQFKNQAGPRGETNEQLEGVGG
jgi:hypothetical protein